MESGLKRLWPGWGLGGKSCHGDGAALCALTAALLLLCSRHSFVSPLSTAVKCQLKTKILFTRSGAVQMISIFRDIMALS